LQLYWASRPANGKDGGQDARAPFLSGQHLVFWGLTCIPAGRLSRRGRVPGSSL
jgi:hypothetical protein